MSGIISNITFFFSSLKENRFCDVDFSIDHCSLCHLELQSIPRQNVHISRQFLTVFTKRLIYRTFKIFNIPELKSNAQMTNIIPLNISDRTTN